MSLLPQPHDLVAVISSDAQALETAEQIAEHLRRDSIERDRERRAGKVRGPLADGVYDHLLDDALSAALEDPRGEVRARAVRAVGRIAHLGARTLLEAAIRDEEAPVRREAARGLGLVAGPGAAAALAEAARDPDAGVRAEVAEALGRIRAPEASEPLSALLADSDPGVRAEASLAVWKLHDPSFAVDGLVEASRSADPALAFCAAYALARLAAEGGEPPSSGAPAGNLSSADRRRVPGIR